MILEGEFKVLCRSLLHLPGERINTKGERQLMRTENFVEYHDGFKDLLCGNSVSGVLAQLAGEVSENETRSEECFD